MLFKERSVNERRGMLFLQLGYEENILYCGLGVGSGCFNATGVSVSKKANLVIIKPQMLRVVGYQLCA